LQQFSAIGTWWEKGNQNELDIVAVDELNRKALIAEVKIKKENISLPALQERASKLLQLQLNEYNVNYVGYSMENM